MGNVVEASRTDLSGVKHTNDQEPTMETDLRRRAARGQADEVRMAADLREERVKARKNAGLTNAESIAKMKPIVPALPHSRLLKTADRLGKAEGLVVWAHAWDGVHPELYAAAKAFGELEATARYGIDWRNPEVHEADVEGGLSRLGLANYTNTRTDNARRDAISAFTRGASEADIESARTRVQVAIASMEARRDDLNHAFSMRRVLIAERSEEAMQRDVQTIANIAEGVLSVAKAGLAAKMGTGSLKGRLGKAGLESAKDTGLATMIVTAPFAEEMARLRTMTQRAQNEAAEDFIRGRLGHLDSASKEVKLAVAELDGARRRAVEQRDARAAALTAVGSAIDERRIERGDLVDGPDWAGHMLSTVSNVERLTDAFAALRLVLNDPQGPILVRCLCDELDERQALLPGAPLDPHFSSPSEHDLRIVRAAGNHTMLAQVVGQLAPEVDRAWQGWQTLRDRILGREVRR